MLVISINKRYFVFLTTAVSACYHDLGRFRALHCGSIRELASSHCCVLSIGYRIHTKTGRLSVAPNHRLYRQNSPNFRSLLQKFKRSSMFDRSSYVVYNTHRPYLVAPQLPSNLALRSTISSLFACLLLVCFRPMFASFSSLLLKMLTVDHFPYPSKKVEFSTMVLCTPGISEICLLL